MPRSAIWSRPMRISTNTCAATPRPTRHAVSARWPRYMRGSRSIARSIATPRCNSSSRSQRCARPSCSDARWLAISAGALAHHAAHRAAHGCAPASSSAGEARESRRAHGSAESASCGATGGSRARGCQRNRRAADPGADRSRSLQGDQRSLRPCRRRPGAQGVRAVVAETYCAARTSSVAGVARNSCW